MPPDPRLPPWGLARRGELDPSHPALVTCRMPKLNHALTFFWGMTQVSISETFRHAFRPYEMAAFDRPLRARCILYVCTGAVRTNDEFDLHDVCVR